MITHTNRYGDQYKFTLQDNGNILWEGSFQLCRVGTMNGKIEMIDPSGGPYIGSGANMGRYGKEFEGMIVKEFTKAPTGYNIIVK